MKCIAFNKNQFYDFHRICTSNKKLHKSRWHAQIRSLSSPCFSFWLIWHACQWPYAIMILAPNMQSQFWWHMCCLCTAVTVRVIITETLYLASICKYTSSICIWNIWSIWCIILNSSHFTKILNMTLLLTSLSLQP